MGVPAKYADQMFSISKTDIHWISDDEIKADFDGFISELRDWVDARCDKRSDNEKSLWAQAIRGKTYNEMTPIERETMEMVAEKLRQQVRCENNLQAELAMQAYEKALQTRKAAPQRPLQ
jgi:hypothetical protein